MDWEAQIATLMEVVIAMGLAGLIGLERELAQKPAGLRTHMLVAAAAVLFVSLGDVLLHHYARSPVFSQVRFDPTGLISAVVTGVSFLGAGTIIQHRQSERLEGLTTATSILVAAGIGIAVALRQFHLAVGVTVLVLIVLLGIRYLEGWMRRRSERRPQQ